MGEALARIEHGQGEVRVRDLPNPLLLSKRSKAILELAGTASEAYLSLRSAASPYYLLASNSSGLTITGWPSEKSMGAATGSADPILLGILLRALLSQVPTKRRVRRLAATTAIGLSPIQGSLLRPAGDLLLPVATEQGEGYAPSTSIMSGAQEARTASSTGL
jgi:hypothetical protein